MMSHVLSTTYAIWYVKNQCIHHKIKVNKVKHASAVISIKQLPVLKGHLFLLCHGKFQMHWASFKRSYETILSWSQGSPLNTGLIVYDLIKYDIIFNTW
jgi:hypothetical protein